MKAIIYYLCVLPLTLSAQVTPEQVLQKALDYHDPNREWETLYTKLTIEEERAEGKDRKTIVTLDNNNGYVKINRDNEEVYEVKQDKVAVLKGKSNEERGLTLRNYYLYLWGLPMKLLDAGTPIDAVVKEETVAGIKTYVLRVPYEKDIWYFYFDQQTGRMVQYKFFFDDTESEGELLKLEGESEIAEMKIPQNRSWYLLPENKYLGKDSLTEID